MTNADRISEQLKELRRRIRGPIEASARELFASENGKKIIDALDRVVRELIEKDTYGRVDPNAILINVGRREIVDYLKGLAQSQPEGQES